MSNNHINFIGNMIVRHYIIRQWISLKIKIFFGKIKILYNYSKEYMKFIYLMTTFMLTFTACTAKKNITLPLEHNTTLSKVAQKDEFQEDEFDDEFLEATHESSDPLEHYNRVITTFNDKAFIYVLNPVSKGYTYLVPEFGRKGVSNFFSNIFYPIRFLNNVLQGKINNAFEETQRFVINTTLGVFGFMDIASSAFNIKAHPEDFGQTLGKWGVSPGPHIVWPFLGPSNLRDSFGTLGDSYINPTNSQDKVMQKYPDNFSQASALYGYYYINRNSLNLGLYESVKKDSLDFYTFSRDFYEAKRRNEIKE
jgi:phospholipid-binding lipoprotein MlaA